MQLFSADTAMFLFIFAYENWKKLASKVAHNWPRTFYFTFQPRPQPRIDFSYYEISGPDICSLICDCHSLDSQNDMFFFCIIGIGGTTMLVTSLSLTAEFIGSNTSSSAFVYSTMSFLDKLLTGFGVFFGSAFQKIPHPVGNLSKKNS